MAADKRPALPFVLTASDLFDGDVVFFAGAGWTRSLGDALVASDEAGADRLETELASAETRGLPVAPYLVKVSVSLDGDGIIVVPDHYRERIRSRGPTVRPDLGPQAQERQHVSL